MEGIGAPLICPTIEAVLISVQEQLRVKYILVEIMKITDGISRGRCRLDK